MKRHPLPGEGGVRERGREKEREREREEQVHLNPSFFMNLFSENMCLKGEVLDSGKRSVMFKLNSQ